MVESISLQEKKIHQHSNSEKHKKLHYSGNVDKQYHNTESVFSKNSKKHVKTCKNGEHAAQINTANSQTAVKPQGDQSHQTQQANTVANPVTNGAQTPSFNEIIALIMNAIQALIPNIAQNPTLNPMQAPMANAIPYPIPSTVQSPTLNPMQAPMINTIPGPIANTPHNPTSNTAQSPVISTDLPISATNKPVGSQDTGSDPIIQAQGRNIFVDSVNGSDSNDGSSPDKAYKTLNMISGTNFQPGDVVNLARGSEFAGGLRITSSGTEDMPITFRAYGSGEMPEISNSGYYSASVSLENNASHIILEGLKATGAMEDGFSIKKGSEYNIIRNCEATDVGIGIALRGENNIATQNYIHDLKLVVNTPGGDDDYGAVGAWLFASNNEISYNKMENLLGQSYDYGMDGGGCEVTGDVSNCKIIGNEITNTNGFMEFSQGTSQGVAANNIIADNTVKDFGDVFTCIHTGSHFGINVRNLQITNNTLINSASKLNNLDNLFNYDGPKLSDSEFILKDNIFITD